MQSKHWMFVAAVAAMVVAPMSAWAAAPGTAMIEGVLTSSGGSPAADGLYDATFAIYDAEAAVSATWTEGPVKVNVSGGRFTWALGSKTPLEVAKLAAAKEQWLGLKIGSDPELPRQALHSTIFSLYAGWAGALSCDGCVSGDQIANGAVAAAKLGFNYAASSTKGGPALDLTCTGCVSVAELKFDGDVDLGGNSIKAQNGTFSGNLTAKAVTATEFVGDGSKLTGIKTVSGECKNAGEVVKGINADGSLKCVAALDPTALPKDGLNEISNDLLSNQFIDTIAGQGGVAIPDNTGAEANSVLDFPDIGTSQTFALTVEVANSDLSAVSLKILPPDDKKTGWTLCDPCGKADEKSYNATFDKDNLPKSGDLAKWIGANPKGTWNLKALDASFCIIQKPGNDKLCDLTKTTDGTIVNWSIKIQTLSNKKIAIAGDSYQAGKAHFKDIEVAGLADVGNVKIGNANAACDADRVGTMRWTAKMGLEVCDINLAKDNSKSYTWFAAKPVPPMWSGGCTSHGTGGGWNTYCTNSAEHNTISDYLTVNYQKSGRFQAKKAGVYRINMWAISHVCNWAHVRLEVNGATRHNGHEHAHNTWTDNFMDVSWPLKAGDTIEVLFYNSGCSSYAYHSYNTSGSHSRLQVEYLGPLSN